MSGVTTACLHEYIQFVAMASRDGEGVALKYHVPRVDEQHTSSAVHTLSMVDGE